MKKARILTHEERLAMTRKNLQPAYPRAEEINEKIPEDENHCPECGAELIHLGSCVECPNKCWSRCG